MGRAAVAFAFHRPTVTPHYRLVHRSRSISIISKHALSANDGSKDSATLTVKATDFDDSLNLSREERTVVNVHRVCKDSVVYVTSVLSQGDIRSSNRSKRWQRRRNKAKEKNDEDQQQKQQRLPKGVALGSGSGFVIDAEGYIVTNYHVIQRAYESNQAMIRYDNFFDGLAKNMTEGVKDSVTPLTADSEMVNNRVETFINNTVSAISGRSSEAGGSSSSSLPAQVFVRFGADGDGDTSGQSSSSASYHQCEIVDVAEDLDVAVLKISNSMPSLKALTYGSSSDLLVGQSLLAIGNPFGLDRTLSQGLVSALGRSVTGVAGNAIKNCIQTDAAINPGNSGGPLLTLNGEVVGVNTMIISTSGSSAGIGFAVPGDKVKEKTDSIVELDKEQQLRNNNRKGRGWLGVDVTTSLSLEASFKKRLSSEDAAIDITSNVNGSVHLGDRIVNVGGNTIADGREFVNDMKTRVEGERLSLMIENAHG